MKTSREIADILITELQNPSRRPTIFICGNGGSAGQAQHFAGELVCKYRINRKALPALALTTDTSIITAIANDFSFDRIFSRQLEALGKQGDILVALSTSGQSKNVLEAIKTAESMLIKVIDFPRIGITTGEIQENHLKYIHEICDYIEQAIERKEL